MNRTKKVLLHFVLCMFTCFTLFLAGCTFQLGGLAQIEGAYKFQKMSYQQGGMTIELEAGEEFMGMLTLSADFAVLTLNEDGSASFTVNAGVEQTYTGSWEKVENGQIALTLDGETETINCDGKTIQIEEDGMLLLLVK